MNENPHRLQQIHIKWAKVQLELGVFYGDDRDNIIPFDFTKPIHTKDGFNKDLSMHLQEVVTYASWQDNNTLKLTLFYIETPYGVTYTIIFEGETIHFQFNINVSINIVSYKATGNLLGVQEGECML